MSRYPIRSRVLKRNGHWLVILPTGRRVMYIGDRLGWGLAIRYANKAVIAEHRFEDDKRRAYVARYSDPSGSS